MNDGCDTVFSVAGLNAKSSTSYFSNQYTSPAPRCGVDHVARVGRHAVALVVHGRQLRHGRQRGIRRQAVDIRRFAADEVVREADVGLRPELQQIRRRGQRVRVIAAVGRPVSRRIVELTPGFACRDFWSAEYFSY